MGERDLSQRSVKMYCESARSAFRIICDINEHALPHNLTGEDIQALLDVIREDGYAVSTQKNYICALTRLTEYYGNYTIRDMRIKWQHDSRPKVDWLTLDQARTLMDCPKSPNQELLVHCELCLGMRRVEVARLRMEHVQGNHIYVIGKGTMGGKLRSVPFHPRTGDVLKRYGAFRQQILAEARRGRVQTATLPNDMMVYRRKNAVLHYSEHRLTGLDKIIEKLSRELGFHFSHHTLRRTFGRTMYRSGIPVATIAKILGHESTDTTLRYIGVDMDDMSEAMEKYMLR